MGFRDGRDSNDHSMTKSETTLSESELLTPSKKSGSSYSPSSPSSSSSGSSFDEDFFQLEGSKDSTSVTGITGTLKLGQDTHLALTNGDKEDISIIVFSPKSQGSMGPASQGYVSGASPDLLLENGSVKQSPPIQVMGRTDDLENSYRIPSSVFARSKSTTQQEWSVASNESLFSIHLGNNSFSREQMVLFHKSGELGKSGELVYPLTKSGELVYPIIDRPGELKSPDHSKSGESGELNNYQISAPQVRTVVKSANNSLHLGEELGVITEAAAETMKEVLRVAAEDRYKEKAPAAEGVQLSSSISRRSDASGTSIQSFAFPMCPCRLIMWIRKPFMWMRKPFMCCRRRKKCAWPSCHCCARPSCHCCARPSCAWPSCHCCARPTCAWPSCHCCAWPSCHCCAWPSCAWPSCYCFNCRRAFCYCSWPSCSCCNGSWAFCYCSNCSRICCCRSRTTLTGDRGKSSSAKTDPELQQLEQHTEPKDIPAAPYTRGSRWFNCFSCFHICRC